MTNVKFYMEPGAGQDTVLAFFPDIIEHTGKNGQRFYRVYSHIGQHSSADILYLNQCTPANVQQYTPLLTELKSMNYNDLNVIELPTLRERLINDNNFSGYMPLPGGYELITHYPGGANLHYFLLSPQGTEILSGKDYKPSPLHDIDSLESIVNLLGFLTTKEGDTDAEYFKDYSCAAMDWTRSNECEKLSILISDYKDKESEYHAAAVANFYCFYTQYSETALLAKP